MHKYLCTYLCTRLSAYLSPGGRFEHYFNREIVTHIVASNLPDAKLRDLLQKKRSRIGMIDHELCERMCLLACTRASLHPCVRFYAAPATPAAHAAPAVPAAHAAEECVCACVDAAVVHPNWITDCVAREQLLPTTYARHGMAWHRTAPHRTTRHGTARHGTARRGTSPHLTSSHRTSPHRTAPCRAAPRYAAPHYTTRHAGITRCCMAAAAPPSQPPCKRGTLVPRMSDACTRASVHTRMRVYMRACGECVCVWSAVRV